MLEMIYRDITAFRIRVRMQSFRNQLGAYNKLESSIITVNV